MAQNSSASSSSSSSSSSSEDDEPLVRPTKGKKRLRILCGPEPSSNDQNEDSSHEDVQDESTHIMVSLSITRFVFINIFVIIGIVYVCLL